ncbi:hypothetical protein NDU88_005772 [Pleurodeles waltl]|uniref:Uncharacterized protein n=1 Tax=Pleurodeles waltl TaxID=8319 RepID=A0AAV7LNK8_PLEWA|nr:hypothetical protein NDU88_005772 [Pleurodeles waltl]
MPYPSVLTEHLDKHMECLDMVKWRVSKAEDEQVTMEAAQKQLDKLMQTLQSKAEDLEASLHRNNLRIVVLTMTTNIANVESFVATLLIRLFGA